jgi:aldose 1-epimerase
MGSSETILRAGDVTVAVFPTHGGRIGQVTVADQPLLVDAPPVGDRDAKSWGAYPMAPWAGRIRGGRFTYGGVEWALPVNHRDGDGGPGRAHAIHGLVFDRDWPDAGSTDAASWSGSCSLDWELGGRVTHEIAVDPHRLTMTLTVESTGSDFPAELGWHPWFRKPDRLDGDLTAMYERDRFGLPTGQLVAPGPRPWDDCFLVRGPVTLHYERPVAPVLVLEADTDHWVIFDEPEDATCVEPQSGPPDAFNLDLAGTPHVVRPGEPLRRRFTISW